MAFHHFDLGYPFKFKRAQKINQFPTTQPMLYVCTARYVPIIFFKLIFFGLTGQTRKSSLKRRPRSIYGSSSTALLFLTDKICKMDGVSGCITASPGGRSGGSRKSLQVWKSMLRWEAADVSSFWRMWRRMRRAMSFGERMAALFTGPVAALLCATVWPSRAGGSRLISRKRMPCSPGQQPHSFAPPRIKAWVSEQTFLLGMLLAFYISQLGARCDRCASGKL